MVAKKKLSAKAKKAYHKQIVKAYHRLEKVVAKHAPKELVHRAKTK